MLWILDAGYSGYWILDTGYWMLDAGCWMLDTGYWMLDTGYWVPGADEGLLTGSHKRIDAEEGLLTESSKTNRLLSNAS